MKRFLSITSLVFLLCLQGIASARADTFTVLVVGDSISAAYGLEEADGWVHLAEQSLQEAGHDVQFVNASISGDTTAGGLRRLPDALQRFEPDLVVIELGGNDGLRGYQPATMQQNLEAMVDSARLAEAEVLIAGMMIPSNYGPAYTQMFSQAFVKAAENSGSELLPFLLEPIANDRKWFQSDGIHPTAEAQPLIRDHILPQLESFINGDS